MILTSAVINCQFSILLFMISNSFLTNLINRSSRINHKPCFTFIGQTSPCPLVWPGICLLRRLRPQSCKRSRNRKPRYHLGKEKLRLNMPKARENNPSLALDILLTLSNPICIFQIILNPPIEILGYSLKEGASHIRQTDKGTGTCLPVPLSHV